MTLPFSGARQRRRNTKKKAARFPERPFLSYGSLTFKRAISECLIPGAYLPASS